MKEGECERERREGERKIVKKVGKKQNKMHGVADPQPQKNSDHIRAT